MGGRHRVGGRKGQPDAKEELIIYNDLAEG